MTNNRFSDGLDVFIEAFNKAAPHDDNDVSMLGKLKSEAKDEADNAEESDMDLGPARDAMSPDQFAVPGKKMLPIHDAYHVRMAWGALEKVKGLSGGEREKARDRIIKMASKWDVDLPRLPKKSAADILYG